MATIRCRGAGGAEWDFDDDVPYVVEQLAAGALVPVDDVTSVEDKPVQKRRGRPPKVADDGDE